MLRGVKGRDDGVIRGGHNGVVRVVPAYGKVICKVVIEADCEKPWVVTVSSALEAKRNTCRSSGRKAEGRRKGRVNGYVETYEVVVHIIIVAGI